jgi:phospholipase C
VFHVYDRKHLTRVPRRYTVDAKQRLSGVWELSETQAAYDLWVLGPNGFHRHFTGEASPEGRDGCRPEIEVSYHAEQGDVAVELSNLGKVRCSFELTPNAYYRACELSRVGPQQSLLHRWSLRRSANWYDFTVKVPELPGFTRRFAGRVETGRDSFSDPALGGPALGER